MAPIPNDDVIPALNDVIASPCYLRKFWKYYNLSKFHSHSVNILEVTEVLEDQKLPDHNRVKPPITVLFRFTIIGSMKKQLIIIGVSHILVSRKSLHQWN